MDFSSIGEQQAMVDAARRFAQQQLKPGYRARECLPRLIAGTAQIMKMIIARQMMGGGA